MIEEVFSNYLSNALNHVYENGTIRIWFERMDSNLRIHVYNDGKCIPEEELNKLWIKFYKVDKARTRAVSYTHLLYCQSTAIRTVPDYN